ncbi:MAG: Unknown protein [uncultured Campylobacterales bacterium]|uniref:MerC domain-containing protein n=1 Tax=uncultured Campylobacterales bacterium TaxID=352960 RepID=A0A6S6SU68_9BACT|nr:MAG: Unknown protein [uncultured Campylobacterales bacterium]
MISPFDKNIIGVEVKMISNFKCSNNALLDSLAIGMSVICAIHCLLTPLLVTLSPLLATTFWINENFHLWMILLVIPTTSIAIFLGCRKHKDRWVVILSFTGLLILVSVALFEWFTFSNVEIHCSSCAGGIKNSTILNIFGAICITLAHTRNYILCRKSSCCH